MSSQAFKSQIVQQFYQDVHNVLTDNYAPERFSYDGVDRSMQFDLGKHVMMLDWFMNSYEELFRVYELLVDQTSKNLYVDLIRYRLAGHLHVRIGSDLPSHAETARQFRQRFAGQKSSLPSVGMFGSLTHYDGEWKKARYTLDTVKDSLINYLVNRQYFLKRDGVVIQPEPGEHLIDGGAFTGDTAVVFSRVVGPQGSVYAFDPVQNHLDICSHNFAQSNITNVRSFGYGLSDQSVEAPTIRLDHYSPGWQVHGSSVPLCRIDDLTLAGRIERIDFIKLDIEGSEMPALQGAVESLRKFRPKLAISIYHRPNDFFEIAKYIHGLGLGYKLYLGHYTIWDEETVLYAKAA